MASTAILGYGTTVEHGEGVVAITKIRKASGPKIEVPQVDVTTFDSPDNFKEFIPGLKDPGDFEIDVLYTAAQAAALYALLGTTEDFLITFTDNSTWAFEAFFKSFSKEIPLEEGIAMTIALKITGKPTFTAA